MPPRKSRKRPAEEDNESSAEKQEISRLKKELAAEKKESKKLRTGLNKAENQQETLKNTIAELRLRDAMGEQLRDTLVNERKEVEQRYAQERLRVQQSRLQMENKLAEVEKKFQGRIDKEVNDKFGRDLQKEIDNTTFYRQELLDLAKRLQEEKEDEGVVFPWKKCEKCKGKYAETGKKVPRVLSCGHTYCEECLRKLCKAKKIVCPADKIVHTLTTTLKDLPINKLVLSM